MPAEEPTCVNERKSPRWRAGECSTLSSAEPPRSAPAERPCNSRSTISPTTAHQPIWANLGSRPMIVVATP